MIKTARLLTHQGLLCSSLGAVLFFSLSACDSLPIEAAGKPGVDYSGLTSWEWTEVSCEEGTPSHLLNGEYAALARTTAEAALVVQGRLQNAEDPSFLIAVYACRYKRLTAEEPYSRFSAGVRRAEPDTRTRIVDQDVLFVDVIDPQSRELLWRATGANHVAEDIDPEQKHLLISGTVRRMVEKLPR